MKKRFFTIYEQSTVIFSACKIHNTAFSCHNNTSSDYAEAVYETVARPHYSTRTGLYTFPMLRVAIRLTVFLFYKIRGAPFPEKRGHNIPAAVRKMNEELTDVYKHMYRSLMTDWD